MSCYRFIHSVFISTCVLLIFDSPTFKAQVAVNYVTHSCQGSTFARGTTYESNLKALLSSLSSSNNSTFATGFRNATYGRSPYIMYGLFLCRPDMSPDVCRNCVGFVANDVLQRCPEYTEAIVWYDECLLHYSNKRFFGLGRTEPTACIMNPHINTSEPNYVFKKLIDEVQRTEKLYAADSNVPSNRTRYGLVQCTRDMDGDTCGSCLNNLTTLVDGCCKRADGCRVLGASCMLRYEPVPFFNQSSNIPVSPPPQAGRAARPRHGTGDDINRKPKEHKVRVVVPSALSSAILVAFLIGFCYYKRRARKDAQLSEEIFLKDLKGKNKGTLLDEGTIAGDQDDKQQMHYISLETILTATNGFSDDNKLGEGGFGPVYKGKLMNGMDVAIKRLSMKSTQGLTEFKNEVILIIKLQHRNLVRLLGYCMEENEKILVYEYMKNKSLDAFLFDSIKCKELDWKTRIKVIHGIAKGIQYLHEDSRLKIIHRDLKASNVLLDDEMNPKISDFGTARIFGCKQIEDNTGRIIGTFGYMSPEYALRGMISEKSDIYSFGVLLLEIISSKKATRFIHDDHQSSLIVYAWESWCEAKGLNLVDQALGNSYSPSEAMRCVHIALLCVQDQVMDRPTISQIVHMLKNDKDLPQPKQPTFAFKDALNNNQQSSTGNVYSIYEATLSTLEGR